MCVCPCVVVFAVYLGCVPARYGELVFGSDGCVTLDLIVCIALSLESSQGYAVINLLK